MWLFGYLKDFRRKISLNTFSRWANHLYFLTYLFNSGLNSRVFWAIFAPQVRESIWGYDPDFSNCCHFLFNESTFLNQKNSNTRIDTNDAKSSRYPNSHTYPNSNTFFGLMKMWPFGGYTVFKNDLESIRSKIGWKNCRKMWKGHVGNTG